MASLTTQQLKDSYQSLVTIGDSITSDPTSGQLENGKGTPLTAVGIGTDSPSADLTVTDGTSAGTLSIGNDSASTSVRYLQFGETNDYSIQSNANSYLRFYAEGAERMRIHDSGDISFRDGSANEAFYWDASTARLGIGTTSPRSILESKGAISIGDTQTTLGNDDPLVGIDFYTSDTSFASSDTNKVARIFPYSDSSVGQAFGLKFSTADTDTDATTRMTIDSSGNVGINKTPENFAQLEIKADTNGKGALLLDSNANTEPSYIIHEVNGSGGWEHGMLGLGSSYSYAFSYGDINTVGNHKVTITNGGNVLVGTTETNSTATATGLRLYNNASTAGRIDFRKTFDGTTNLTANYHAGTYIGGIVASNTATSYNTSSDYRLKENVVPMEGALDRVDQLKPSRFNFIADADTTVDGFLAHEVQEIVPEAITGEKDATEEYEVTPAVLDEDGNVIEEAVMGTRPVYQGIDQSKLVPLLVGAIQELKAEIEQLKAK